MLRTRIWTCIAVVTGVIVLAGCSGSSHPSAGSTTTATGNESLNTVPGATTSSTVPIQANGPRTVLSPIGINVRAEPSTTASIVGSAAQGAILTVLSHTDQGGGWYQVTGATTTGYVTDNPALSAAGKFTAYSATDGSYSALYPANWTAAPTAPDGVVFQPPSGQDSIVVTTAATVRQLGQDQLGYRATTSATVVLCGVTGELVTFVRSSGSAPTTTTPTTITPTTITGSASSAAAPAAAVVPEHYLVQIQLTLDAQHALGVDANLADLTLLPTVNEVLNSLSFPFPQCQGASAPGDTTSTAPASTVP